MDADPKNRAEFEGRKGKMDTVCTTCRRAGMKLYLKGERCFSPKCSFTRRSYQPGAHGTKRRQRLSEYARELHEKQRAKEVYGLRERSFRKYFQEAARESGSATTGGRLVQLLEMRLDTICYRAGFAPSRKAARQLIAHRKVKVDNTIRAIPSLQLKNGSIVSLVGTSSVSRPQQIPSWLRLEKKKREVKLVKVPTPQEIATDFDPNVIVEFYSR